MDLSSVGRAGLSAVLPVLAACGVQACGLPSALFSTHMGGFAGVRRLDTAGFCAGALEQWRAEGVAFDAVYTGYMNSEAQFAVAKEALALWPDALKVVDPAMADGGRLYGGLPKDTPDVMAALCAKADLCTPNLTEASLLCGQGPREVDEAGAHALLEALRPATGAVLVTSVPGGATGAQMLGADAAGAFAEPVYRQPGSYPGTGDAFTAAVTGLLLRGHSLREATRHAARFLEAAVSATVAGGGEARQGVWLEGSLHLLWEACAPCRS